MMDAYVTFKVVVDNYNTLFPNSTGVSYKLSSGTRSSNTSTLYQGDNGTIVDGYMTILTPGSLNGDKLILSGDVVTPGFDITNERTRHIRGVGTVVAPVIEPEQEIWLTLDGTDKFIEVVDGDFIYSTKITYQTNLTGNYIISNLLSVVSGVLTAPGLTIKLDGVLTTDAPTDGEFHECELIGTGTLTHVGSDDGSTNFFAGGIKTFSVDSMDYTLDKYTLTYQMPDGGIIGDNVIIDPYFDNAAQWNVLNGASVAGSELVMPTGSGNGSTIVEDDVLIPTGKVFQFDWEVTSLTQVEGWEYIQFFSRDYADYKNVVSVTAPGVYRHIIYTTGQGLRIKVTGAVTSNVNANISFITAKEWLNTLVFHNVVTSDYDDEAVVIPPPIPTGDSYPKIAGMNISAHDMDTEWKMDVISRQDLAILGLYRTWTSSDPLLPNPQAVAKELKRRNPSMLVGKYVMPMQVPNSGDLAKSDLVAKAYAEDWFVLNQPSGDHVTNVNYGGQDLINLTDWAPTESTGPRAGSGDRYCQWKSERDNEVFFNFTPNNFDVWYFDNNFTAPRTDIADWNLDGANENRNTDPLPAKYRQGIADGMIRARELQPNMLFMGNTSESAGCANDYDEYRYLNDGGFFEHAINDYTDEHHRGVEYWHGWENVLNWYRCIIANSKNLNAVYTIFAASSNTPQWSYTLRTMRYGLCTALMDNGYYSFGSYGAPTWYDEYDIELGRPIDAPPTDDWNNSGLWKREFEFGMAIVNPRVGTKTVPPFSNTISFTIPAGFARFDASYFGDGRALQDSTHNNGQEDGDVDLGECDGIILIRTDFVPVLTGEIFPKIAGVNVGAHDMDTEWKMDIISRQDLAILGMWNGWTSPTYANPQAVAKELKRRNPNMLVGKYNMTMQIPLDGEDMSKQDLVNKCKAEADWYVLDEPSGEHVIGQNVTRELVNITKHTTPDSNNDRWPEYFMKRCNTAFFNFTPNYFDIQYLDNFFTKPRVDNADWNLDGSNDNRNDAGVAEDYRDAYVDMVNQGRISQPNMLIMGTTADGIGSSCAFDNDEFNGVLDGGFLEHAINDPGGITEGTNYWNGWDKALDRYRCLLSKSKNVNQPYTIFGCSSDNSTGTLNIETMRYGLCTALLDNGYFSFGSYSSPTWYDEYDVVLGRAVDDPPLVEWAGNSGLWKREFEFGMSIVNPVKMQQQVFPYPNQIPIQFNIPSGFKRFDASYFGDGRTLQDPSHNNGQDTGNITLNEGDGIILIRE